jgi:hypothetical protein
LEKSLGLALGDFGCNLRQFSYLINFRRVNTLIMCKIHKRLTKHHIKTFDALDEWTKWHSEGDIMKRKMDDAPIVRNFEDKPAEQRGKTEI